jgi:hypothetical protein
VEVTFTLFDVPGALNTHPEAVNDHGVIVGLYDVPQGTRAFIREPDGSFQSFDYPGLASPTTFGLGVNNRRDIVGFFLAPASRPSGAAAHGFLRRSDGVFTQIDYPDAADTFLHGINARGAMVGSFADTNGATRSFIRESNGDYTEIAFPGADWTAAYGINDGGEVVGAWHDPAFGDRGFIRTRKGQYVPVDYAPGVSTWLTGINRHGDVSGMAGTGLLGQTAFLRDRRGRMTEIAVPCTRTTGCPSPTMKTWAMGMNAHDQVVGHFEENPSGTGIPIHGFIAQMRK